jgi:UDP-N-acetylmuramate--L-alanine ligase/UDP-N-acetylenolpyruvoylglucosamine reductase
MTGELGADPKAAPGVTVNAEASISDLLSRGGSRVHMLGVCGVGMAGLALLLKRRGISVSGCDAGPGRLAEWLRVEGIEVAPAHDAGHLARQTDWVIRSAAVPLHSPELRRARELGLPVFSRGQVLPALFPGHTSVAVAGTHGKTTTATFIAHVLRHAGRDPSWCIGGDCVGLGGVAGAGRGGILVVEADESDGTLALYRPDLAVVTNVEFDHMENFANVEAFEQCFATFMRNARSRVIFCGEDPRASALGRELTRGASYGFGEDSVFRGRDLETTDVSLRFAVDRDGREMGRIELPVPGVHNARNALAAAAAALELGLGFREIQEGLAAAVLPRRRFERVSGSAGVTVISDYAHHPTEVAALVRTALRLPHRRLLAVFQPHRYTRTRALGSDFPPAFDGVDELILTPVYAASEAPLDGGSVWDLYEHFRARPPITGRAGVPRVAGSLAQAWEFLRRNVAEDDVLLVVGAGDVEKIAHWARQASASGSVNVSAEAPPGRLRSSVIRLREPLAAKTTFRVGGRADVWAEVGDDRDLRSLLGWAAKGGMPFRAIGGGSNVLVSDLGLRGLTVRLAAPGFTQIEQRGGEVVAGGAVSLARLLDWTSREGWAGLEFLERIPGMLGGAVRMNAGAWGQAIGDHLSWVRCLDRVGAEQRLERRELGAGYRECRCLADRIVVEAGLRLERDAPAAILARRQAVAERRRWMAGMRCAGSVFKNPEGDFAGRLLEQAAMKGCRVGGACVSPAHANVIVTEEGATASDVAALAIKSRQAVRARFGVELGYEIVLLE